MGDHEMTGRVTLASTLGAMRVQLAELHAALLTAVGDEHSALESMAMRLCARIAALSGKAR